MHFVKLASRRRSNEMRSLGAWARMASQADRKQWLEWLNMHEDQED